MTWQRITEHPASGGIIVLGLVLGGWVTVIAAVWAAWAAEKAAAFVSPPL
jgi:hypothetical protein